MKKKYITIFIALTFVFIVPSGIPVHATSAVHSTLNGRTIQEIPDEPISYGGFNYYNESISYRNVTIPDFNSWQLGINDYGRHEPQEPILANHLKFYNQSSLIVGRGFIYQNINNTLSAYMISTGKYYIISTKWENLTYNTDSRIFWASRQDIFYTELNNGTLDSITDYGVINGYFYVQAYFPLNNTYKLSNTTLSVSDIAKYGENYSFRSPCEWNIYPLSLNGTYLIDFSVGVAVNKGLFVWSIFGSQDGHMIAFNIGGIGLASRSGQSSMTEYSFQGQIASQREITFDYFNWTTDKFVVMARSMHDGDATTCNNQPYYITPLPDGNYKITLYQDLNDSSTYWLWHFYYNSNTHNVSTVYINARNLHVDDMETAANQEVLVSNYGFITGITDSLTYITGYANLYSPYLSYVRLSAYRSTNPWFNSLFHKTGNPLINVLVAGYNNSVMYVWKSSMGNSDIPAIPGEFIVYSMQIYPVHFTAKNLESHSKWELYINGSTETHVISGSNFTDSLPNGSYSLVATDNNSIIHCNFTVNGKAIDIAMKFPSVYQVDFRESGLHEHCPYSVSINGSIRKTDNDSLDYTVPNGTYSYTARAHDYKWISGIIRVDGTSEIVNLTFIRQVYHIEISESGLPGGTFWNVNITKDHSLNATNITLSLSNATYHYTVTTSNKDYCPDIPAGTLKVNGVSLDVHIVFMKLYKVKFVETGLPPGTVWYLNFSNGESYHSSSSSIMLKLHNGTYDYIISTSNGNLTGASQGTLKVDGSGIEVHVEAVKPESGFPLEDGYIVIGSAIAILAGIISLLIIKGKKIRK